MAKGENPLEVLAEGLEVPLGAPESRPDWLDEEQLRKGRQFAIRYLFGLLYAEMLSLAMLFSFRGSREPLLFTGNSDTPQKAFIRYLSTSTRVISWYESDAWKEGTEAHRNMAVVRHLHDSVVKRLKECSRKEMRMKLLRKDLWCPYFSELKKDLCAVDYGDRSFLGNDGLSVYLNQLDMSLTQFGFVGLMILFPHHFGASSATEDDLEGFVHLWRGLGHLLGIEDRYNFCAGGLSKTRERSKAVLAEWVKPSLCTVTPEWEHMYRCVVEGISYYVPGNTFGGAMCYLLWVIGVPSPNLRAVMSWKETFLFYLHRFVLGYLLRIPGMLSYHNWLIRIALKKASSWVEGDKVDAFQRKSQRVTSS